MFALDFATRAHEMKRSTDNPTTLSAACTAVTRDGTPVIASAWGRQIASYAWGAANVIFVVGAPELVPTPGRRRTSGSTSAACRWKTPARMPTYAQHSQVAKILEIHQELPGPVNVVLVLICQQAGL